MPPHSAHNWREPLLHGLQQAASKECLGIGLGEAPSSQRRRAQDAPQVAPGTEHLSRAATFPAHGSSSAPVARAASAAVAEADTTLTPLLESREKPPMALTSGPGRPVILPAAPGGSRAAIGRWLPHEHALHA